MSDRLRAAAQAALEAMDDMATDARCAAMPESRTTEFDAARDDLRAALAQPAICTWHGDEEGTYETSCNHLFQVIDGTPEENSFKNCCFCGLWLESHPWEDGNDE